MGDSDSSAPSDDDDHPVPCDVQLLSGNQFRTMMEKELSQRPPATPYTKKQPDTCPTCKQPIKPRPKRPLPAGRAMQAVRHMPLPGNLQEPGKAEEYYLKMLEEKEKVKMLMEEKKTWKRKIADAEKSVKAEKKQEDTIATILKAESGNHKVNGLLKEIVMLNNTIKSLKENNKMKAKELTTLQAASPTTSKGRSRKMMNELKKSDDTISMLRTQLSVNATGSTDEMAAFTKAEDLKQRNATLKNKVATLKEDLAKAERCISETYMRTLMAEWALHATLNKRVFVERQLADVNDMLTKEKERHARTREDNEETIKHLEAAVKREHDRVVSTTGQLQQIQYHAKGRGTEEWAQMVRNYEDALSQKDADITDLEGKVLESDRQYRDLEARTRDAEGDARKKTSALFKEDIVKRDQTIERLEKELANLAKQTQGLSTEKDATRRAASVAMSAKDEAAKKQEEGHQKKVERYKGQVAKLKEELGEMRKENKGLRNQQTAQDAKIEKLREEQERKRLMGRKKEDEGGDGDGDDDDDEL